MNWYLEVWKKFAVFQGRARRKEYWFFALFNVLAIAILTVIDTMIGTFNMQTGIGVLSGLYCIAVLLPSLAVGVRRLHDIGKSGWWLPLGLVPLVGGIVLLVFALLDSEPGTNEYGPNPKGVATAAAVAPTA
jgi:uncharacterized membrane protein YhaH (DUF805 family)